MIYDDDNNNHKKNCPNCLFFDDGENIFHFLMENFFCHNNQIFHRNEMTFVNQFFYQFSIFEILLWISWQKKLSFAYSFHGKWP